VKLELLKSLRCIGVAIGLVLSGIVNAHAILQHPDKQQVEQALEKGVVFAREHRPPNELYWRFGSTGKFEPQGFLVTKISGLAVMSSHYALRGEQPTVQDIQRVLEEEANRLRDMNRAVMADSIRPVVEAGLVDLVDHDQQIAPEVRLIPTPGHTIGHVSVRVDSAGESALITGDFVHHPCQLAHPEWSVTTDFDPAALGSVPSSDSFCRMSGKRWIAG